MTDDDFPLLCHHCGCSLHPGRGNFYVVRIEALADPSPPDLNGYDEMTPADINEEFARLIETTREASPQDLMDQVYRRLTLHLCNRCYRRWIENPTG